MLGRREGGGEGPDDFAYIIIKSVGTAGNTTLLLFLLLPVEDWAVSACCKSCSDGYLKGGHGQCLECY